MRVDWLIQGMSEKQRKFMLSRVKHTAYGGARGGGKSWAVRTKCKLMALRYPGIRQLIIRKTYDELKTNHADTLRAELRGLARYRESAKEFIFHNGSWIKLQYCANDRDLERIQGVEYDVIYIDEATQLTEYQLKAISACLRGANDFPKRMYYTCNPGGPGHAYIKRVFVDRNFQPLERPEDYDFIQALPGDNAILMKKQPDYIAQLEALPKKLRDAWLYGKWDVFSGQVFEEFTDNEEHYQDRKWTHVIEPIPLDRGPARGWTIYRSYDWGYAKPFSVGWWAVDYDGILYRIMELYGGTETPDEGCRWTTDEQFREIARIEREHPWLAGREIHGVADPSIWDASRGESTADVAMRHGIYFTPGDNQRLPGWMQCHYRLAFDAEGYPKMYVYKNCRAFIRTIPLLQYDEHTPEDVDTSQEDHVADEWRYMCMSRPLKPALEEPRREQIFDPLGREIYARRER